MLDQLALADLFTRGDFDRHLRHRRRLYQRRREALLAALAARFPHSSHRRRRRPARRPPPARRARRPSGAAPHGVALDAIGGSLIVGYANLPESQAPPPSTRFLMRVQ